MQLRDTIDEIRRRNDWTQKEFAAAVGIDGSAVSRLGNTWDKHWKTFIEILRLCDEVGIDPRKPRKMRAIK